MIQAFRRGGKNDCEEQQHFHAILEAFENQQPPCTECPASEHSTQARRDKDDEDEGDDGDEEKEALSYKLRIA